MRRLVEDAAQFAIRRMVAEDLPAVLAIEQVAFRHPWSPELVKRELTHEWSTILLAEELDPRSGGMRLLGFSIFWVVHDELHVLNVATSPDHRRRGVGRSLMDATLCWAREKKCKLATLELRKSNEAALQLYKSLSFKQVGVRRKYYVDEGEDAIVMVLDL